ncbi:MAG: hypothetical protein AVDCRST_MAG19-1252, partial [uncultured Thermomicrobiales bacterium]
GVHGVRGQTAPGRRGACRPRAR